MPTGRGRGSYPRWAGWSSSWFQRGRGALSLGAGVGTSKGKEGGLIKNVAGAGLGPRRAGGAAPAQREGAGLSTRRESAPGRKASPLVRQESVARGRGRGSHASHNSSPTTSTSPPSGLFHLLFPLPTGFPTPSEHRRRPNYRLGRRGTPGIARNPAGLGEQPTCRTRPARVAERKTGAPLGVVWREVAPERSGGILPLVGASAPAGAHARKSVIHQQVTETAAPVPIPGESPNSRLVGSWCANQRPAKRY